MKDKQTPVFLALVVVATFAATGLFITGIVFNALKTPRQEKCDYLIKEGCLTGCGCSWCESTDGSVAQCQAHSVYCEGMNVTSAADCEPTIIPMIAFGSLLAVTLVLMLLFFVLIVPIKKAKRRYSRTDE